MRRCCGQMQEQLDVMEIEFLPFRDIRGLERCLKFSMAILTIKVDRSILIVCTSQHSRKKLQEFDSYSSWYVLNWSSLCAIRDNIIFIPDLSENQGSWR